VQSAALIKKDDFGYPLIETVVEKFSTDVRAEVKRTAGDIARQRGQFFCPAMMDSSQCVAKEKGGISMYRRLAMVISVIMITGLLAGPAASADDNSCWLQAEQSLYLAIYDLDSLGNILSQIWEGVLDQGGKKLVKSSNGKIRYYTSPDADVSSPGINLTCHNNEVISVP
jgi:hypothetical protein